MRLLGLGGWTTFGGSVKDSDLIKQIHRRAYEAGINFFDNADVYAKGESEKVVGKALKEFPRHELVISSKTFWPMSDDVNDKGLSRKHIIESVNKSLQRMQTDYFDLYFCHRFDSETPLEETIRTMDDLIRQGKILYWGTSEWTASQLDQAAEICKRTGWTAPRVEQPQYHLLERKKFENEVAPVARRLGMGLVTWSPLASGALTGKYDSQKNEGRLSKIEWLRETYLSEQNQIHLKKFKKFSQEVGVSQAELALAWVASQQDVSSVILGVTKIEQLEQNLRALNVKMGPDWDIKLKEIFKP